MPHADHPNIVTDRVIVRLQLPDPRPKRVLVVETKIALRAEDPGFNQHEYDALIAAVRDGMDRARVDEAEIVPV